MLLELTNGNCGVNPRDLAVRPQPDFQERLAELIESGLVTCTNDLLSMQASQRVRLAEQLIHGGIDPRKVSTYLAWQEFEEFAQRTLSDNGFTTQGHLVFKSQVGRREIDVLAWNDTFTLALDCKHWLRALSPGRMRKAAQAQVERVLALARRPELLYRLKIPHPENRSITPVILALGELRVRFVERVPIVSISKLPNFIYGLSPIDEHIQRVKVSNPMQGQLRLA
jgi:hypothetical protein